MNFIDAFLEEVDSHDNTDKYEILGSFNSEIGYSSAIEEYIGSFSKTKNKKDISVHVYEDEGDHVPHMHLIKEGEPDCCIRIDKAEYFSHGRHSNTINSKTLKRFITFMKRKNIKFGQSNYKFAIYSWNKYNKHDQLDINMEMPDYSRLNKS